MFNLQLALEGRLASLNKKKPKKSQGININDTSLTYIKDSLTQAGILDKQGNIKRLTH